MKIKFRDYPVKGVHCKLLTVEVHGVFSNKDRDIVRTSTVM